MLVRYDEDINMQVFDSFARIVGNKNILNTGNASSTGKQDEQIEGSQD